MTSKNVARIDAPTTTDENPSNLVPLVHDSRSRDDRVSARVDTDPDHN